VDAMCWGSRAAVRTGERAVFTNESKGKSKVGTIIQASIGRSSKSKNLEEGGFHFAAKTRGQLQIGKRGNRL